MKETVEGVVIEIAAEIAKVKISRHSDCKSCGLCEGQDALVLHSPNTLDTKPGQRVLLQLKEDNMLKAAFAVFIFPVIAVSGGIYLGYLFSSFSKTSGVVSMTIGGFVFGLVALLVVKRLDISLESASDMPTMIKVIK